MPESNPRDQHDVQIVDAGSPLAYWGLSEQRHDVMHIDPPESCWVCGGPADWVDVSFEAPVCGGICIWAAWEALRLHDTSWRAW